MNITLPIRWCKILQPILKEKTTAYNLLKKTVGQIGYPRWDKAMIINKPQASGRGNTDSSNTTYYVPFVRDSQNYVNASMIIKAFSTDTSFFYKCDWEYSTLQNNISSISDSIEHFAVFFMVMDNNVFGHKKFAITDTTLFRNGDYTASFVSFDSSLIFGRNNNLTPIEHCVNVSVYREVPCTGRSSRTQEAGRNNIVFKCFEHISYNYCWYGDTGGGGLGYGSGNSGGGGTGSGTPSECDPGPTSGNRTEINESCGPGWFPIVPIDDNDRNLQGYLYTKLDSLYNEITTNPYFLLDPCNYLNQFYWLGNHQVSNNTSNRIDSINQVFLNSNGSSVYENFLETPYFVLNLNNASGTVVNCDYFPIHITTLPVVNGVQWTSQQLFQYFRNNMNQFINTNIAEFFPYKHDSYIDDSVRWHSSNPLSSLLHLNMMNDGTVIVSDYWTTLDSSRFIVSTLRSPLDGIHPVSGNRAWGISPDHANGGYIFYTTAVDRITNVIMDLFNDLGELTPLPSGFEIADNLWRSLQDKMILFINNNNGNAAKYVQLDELKFRPHWILMREFLLGNISLAQLKLALGCP